MQATPAPHLRPFERGRRGGEAACPPPPKRRSPAVKRRGFVAVEPREVVLRVRRVRLRRQRFGCSRSVSQHRAQGRNHVAQRWHEGVEHVPSVPTAGRPSTLDGALKYGYTDLMRCPW